jgi:hypothetical protein
MELDNIKSKGFPVLSFKFTTGVVYVADDMNVSGREMVEACLNVYARNVASGSSTSDEDSLGQTASKRHVQAQVIHCIGLLLGGSGSSFFGRKAGRGLPLNFYPVRHMPQSQAIQKSSEI